MDGDAGSAEGLRQGDWLRDVAAVALMTGDAETEWQGTAPHGCVVLTQCCDLAQNHTDIVHLAPVVHLEGRSRSEAESGRTSRYALVDAETGSFADLSVVVSASRALADLKRVSKRLNSDERKKFADRVARRFTRFAYPTELNPVLKPLRDKIRSKARKAGSIAQVLYRVATLRMECAPDWDARGDLSLTLLVVVEDGYLPSLLSMPEPDPARGLTPVEASPSDLAEIADRILATQPEDPQTNELWQLFGEALGDLLESNLPDNGLVADVAVEVMDVHELTYDRWRNSVDLDLDDLSDSS